MAVFIAMLRGVNVGGHQKLNMEALRALGTGLGLQDVRSYIQSGNLVFRDDRADPGELVHRLQSAIEGKFGFKPGVVLRTAAELQKVVAKNPFAGRDGIEPGRLLVLFLAEKPSPQACAQILALPSEPEEHVIHGHELYVYYPNGMARPRIPLVRIEKMLQCVSTGRNWNTVNTLLDMARQTAS
jgi:uncharacterized protein (DUF1697 family)